MGWLWKRRGQAGVSPQRPNSRVWGPSVLSPWGARSLPQPLRSFILHPSSWPVILEPNGTFGCRRGLAEDRECGQVPREAQINISFSLSPAGSLRLSCRFRQKTSRVRWAQCHAGDRGQGRWKYTRKHGRLEILSPCFP